jgi:GT2 family glycosyltransferase
MEKVSIVIPAFMANLTLRNMTKRCVESIKEDVEIIVVDDGSPIKAPDFDKEIVLIELPQNMGYACAVNAGLEAANGDYLIVCNNDIEFIDPHWLEALLKPLKRGAGISTIRTTEPDGWETKDLFEENAKFGSLYCITRATYETLGGLDEGFGKGYGEDLDYWHRARNEGIRIVKNHNGLAEHLGKATFKVIDPADKAFNRFIVTYKTKWPDQFHIFMLDKHSIIGFNDWELKDMSEEDKEHYCKEEITLEQLRERFGPGW